MSSPNTPNTPNTPNIPEPVLYGAIWRVSKNMDVRWACRCAADYLTVCGKWGWIKQFDFAQGLERALRDPEVWAFLSVFNKVQWSLGVLAQIGLELAKMACTHLPNVPPPPPTRPTQLEYNRWAARQPTFDRLCNNTRNLCEFDVQRFLALVPGLLTPDNFFEQADVLAMIPDPSFSAEEFVATEGEVDQCLDPYLKAKCMSNPCFYVKTFLEVTGVSNKFGAHGEAVIRALVEYAFSV